MCTHNLCLYFTIFGNYNLSWAIKLLSFLVSSRTYTFIPMCVPVCMGNNIFFTTHFNSFIDKRYKLKKKDTTKRISTQIIGNKCRNKWQKAAAAPTETFLIFSTHFNRKMYFFVLCCLNRPQNSSTKKINLYKGQLFYIIYDFQQILLENGRRTVWCKFGRPLDAAEEDSRSS